MRFIWFWASKITFLLKVQYKRHLHLYIHNTLKPGMQLRDHKNSLEHYIISCNCFRQIHSRIYCLPNIQRKEIQLQLCILMLATFAFLDAPNLEFNSRCIDLEYNVPLVKYNSLLVVAKVGQNIHFNFDNVRFAAVWWFYWNGDFHMRTA